LVFKLKKDKFLTLFNKLNTQTILAISGLSILSLYAADFLVKGEIIYGSQLATQWTPVIGRYVNNIKTGIFPFYDFYLTIGMNSLGESQQSLLHPIMILLSFIIPNSNYLITSFLTIHVVMLGIGFYLYTLHMLKRYTDSSIPEWIAFFVGSTQILSVGLYANLIHHFYVSSLAYLPFLLLFSEKFFLEAKRRYFIVLSFTVTLMILCGHFGIQWISLLFFLFYICGRIYLDSRIFLRATLILVTVGMGFLISSAQLVPTLDLMTLSTRSNTGGLSMLLNSAEPLNWLGYFSPGNLYMLYRNNLFWTWTGAGLTEGVHYIGLIPMALLIYSLYMWGKMLPITKLFQSLTLIVFLRALGLFSIINIFLNMLPIFGNFRMSVRSFFILDVTIAMVAAFVMVSGINRTVFKKVLEILALVVLIFNLVTFAILISFHLFEEPRDISLLEFGYNFVGLGVILIIRILLSERYTHFINGKSLILVLIMFSIIDLAIFQAAIPTIWKRSNPKDIVAQGRLVDDECKKVGTNHIWVTSIWPEYNKLHFPLTDNYGPNYTNPERDFQPELMGSSCHLTYYLTAPTLTPLSLLRVGQWGETLSKDEKMYSLPWLLGFENVGQFKDIHGQTHLDFIKTKIPTPETVVQFKQLINQETDGAKGLFVDWIIPTYHFLEQFDILKHLPQRIFEPRHINGLGKVIVLNPPFNYLIFDQEGHRVHYQTKGPFLIFDPNVEDPVKVVYVPIDFIVGLFGSVMGLFLTIVLTLSLKAFIKRELITYQISENWLCSIRNSLTNSVNMFIKLINHQMFHKIGVLFVILSTIFTVYYSSFLQYDNHPLMILYLFILNWCIYIFTKFITSKPMIAHGVWIIFSINFLAGSSILIFLLGSTKVIGYEYIRLIKRTIFSLIT